MTLTACGGGSDSNPPSQYFTFLGGNISGLNNGNSVTLQNNGKDDLTLSGNGAFNFAAPVEGGTNYNVTVLTQPRGQTCTVTNGSGTISSVSEDHIAIRCVSYAYNIGGRLSGLASGKSVTLELNGGNGITLGSNAAFNFSPVLRPGETYSAAVTNQPANQTCTVTNGGGTVSGGDVTNIAVTCTLNPYFIGGTVSGLSAGKTITLQLNGGDTVTVGGNGDFNFVEQVVSGSAYNVSVLFQPAGQSCAMKSGSGVVDSADITSVAVTCRTWGTAVPIDNITAGAPSTPQVSIDKNGNAIAVWSQSDGANINIYANRYTVASGWGTELAIDSDNGGAGHPQIAVDTNGNAIAVWSQANNIYANRYVAGGSWDATATPVENINTGNADSPEVTVDSGGIAIAVWHQFEGAQQNIYANRFGASWDATPTLIRSNTTGNANSDPQVDASKGNNAFAVWSESDGTHNYIYANRYIPNTGWGTSALIQSDKSNDGVSPQIATEGNGNAIAVWYQYDGSHYNIWANRYTAAKGWGSAEIIETNNAGSASHPRIAIGADGNAIAVWEQSDGVRYYIWANRYTAGTGWGNARIIQSDNSGNALDAQIAFDADGNATVVWAQYDGTRYNIWANQYIAGTGWGTAALIETDNAGDAVTPQIAVSANGNAVVVWLQKYDATNYNVMANVLK